MKKLLLIFASFVYLAFANNLVAQTGSWKLAGNNLTGTEKLGSKNNFDLNFISNNATRMTIKGTGDVLIGNSLLPSTKISLFGNQILDGDLTLASSLGKGDVNFTSDQQSITFANPGASPASMIYMFNSPTSNKRMVISHSASFSNWGLQYDDAIDQFNFLGNGNNRMAINLTNGFIGINNASPGYRFDVTGNSRIVGNLGVQTAPNTRTIQAGSTQGSLIGIGTAEYIQDAGINLLAFNENIIPVSDNLWSNGSSTNRWTAVWAVDGTINTSDARDKTNIRDLDYGMKEIMQLHAIKFNWKNNSDAGDKLGVIAQEIKKVLPEVVRDWVYQVDEETGRKTKMPSAKLGVMYADIIPVLIRGMQEQQKQIDELKQLVNQLSNAQLNSNSPANTIILSNISLEQNTPNPVKGITTIRYNMPNKNAQLNVTDGSGKLIKQIQLNEGAGSVNIDCSSFSEGTYYYSIVADGKILDNKKMVVVK
jgi:hypothetical protein